MSCEPHSRWVGRRERKCVVCRTSEKRHPDETIAHIANRAAARNLGADIAVVLEDLELPNGWLERLRATAAGESTTATVCALPSETAAGDFEDEISTADPVVLRGHGATSPRVGLVVGPCVFLSRAAFDLLGGMDESLPTSPCAVADFGLRARERGLANLLAGDLLIPARGAARLSDDDRVELAGRFPALWRAAQDPDSAAVERSVALARTALRKLSVTIDARSLGVHTGGTQVYTLELIRALAATGMVRIRALVGLDLEATSLLEDLDDISVITYEQAIAGTDETDLVHRPQQVFTLDDLELLRPLGRRLVITHLDLIAYHNPTYFSEFAHWRRHVRATRIGLAAADHVLFFSTHALRDAEREDLIDPQRASVVQLGVDPSSSDDKAVTQPRALADRNEPFLLCLGADYAHKNRPFALELAAELRRAHGWPGILVLVGAHVEHGSSAPYEQRVRELRPELEGAVIDLGPISDAERRWLMVHARALLYPTVLEGFGLVPFEAAVAGVPCLFASQSSLAELLPAELSTLDGWSLERSSALVAHLLTDESARERHIKALRSAGHTYTWEQCAERTIEAYRRTLASRAVWSGRQAWEALEREQEIVRLDQAVNDLQTVIGDLQNRLQAYSDSFGADAVALVGPEGLLSRADQRALLALAVRPALRRPLFASARAGHRLASRRRTQR
jgi:glycosyltransferase involved in cell wall biosynthesis